MHLNVAFILEYYLIRRALVQIGSGEQFQAKVFRADPFVLSAPKDLVRLGRRTEFLSAPEPHGGTVNLGAEFSSALEK